MKLSINHLTFSVSNLQVSVDFYQNVFNAKLLVKGDKLAYFDLDGIWLALNLEQDIPRNEINQSYTHISFTITEQEYPIMVNKLQALKIHIIESRARHAKEGNSIYFRDPDGHLFEFHTKTKEDRINFYKQQRPELSFFE